MRLAAIDVGTNTTRLLVVDASGHDLDRQLAFTRLGKGTDATGALDPAAVERTLKAVGEYCAIAGEFEVRHLRVAGTSAVRDAANSDELISAIEKVAGTSMEILSGHQEAKLTFMGGTKDASHGLYLVCDIGGGSTEFALGFPRKPPEVTESVDIGSVRLTERLIASDPPETVEMLALEGEIDVALESLDDRLSMAPDAKLIGVAGTITTLGAIHLGKDGYDPEATHGMDLSRDEVQSLYKALASLRLDQRKALRGLPDQRADVIVAGASILSRVMAHWDFDSVQISEKDILDGLVLDMLPTEEADG